MFLITCNTNIYWLATIFWGPREVQILLQRVSECVLVVWGSLSQHSDSSGGESGL